MDDRLALERMRRDFAEVAAGGRFLELIEKAPAVWRERPATFHLWLARKLAHLTQRQLAALAGVDQGFVCRVERGRDVRLSSMRRLYEALGYRMLIVPLRMRGQRPRRQGIDGGSAAPERPIAPRLPSAG